MSSFRLLPLLCAAALLFCSGCTAQQGLQSSTSPEVSAPQTTLPDESAVTVMAPHTTSEPSPALPDPPAHTNSEPLPATPTQSKEAAPDPSQLPHDSSPETDPIPSLPPLSAPDPIIPEPPPAPIASNYDFSQPIPESTPVENDYFSDAAFAGDSRMEGFWLYSGVKKGQKLAVTGLSVFNLDKKAVLTSGGKCYTLPEALTLTQYAKIYLGFGINELGYINEQAFYAAYCQAIDLIRSRQPNAVIYAQTLIPVNESQVRAAGGAGHLNNDRIRLYNSLIRKAAIEKQVPIMDLYSAFAVDGSLPAQASRDGVHLTGDYCRKQLEYLKTHTIDFDALYTPPHIEMEVPNYETTPAPDPLPDPEPATDSLLPDTRPDSLYQGAAPATSGN